MLFEGVSIKWSQRSKRPASFLDILNKFFSDKAKTDAFIAALDACVSGVAQEAINLFNRWWTDIRFNTFITSISEHDDSEDLHGRLSMWRALGMSTATFITSISEHDDSEDLHGRLSMWRALGMSTARVAIVFKVSRFSPGALALRLIFSPVAYLTEDETHAVLAEVMTNIGTNRDFLRSIDRQVVVDTVFMMLLAGVTCLKHEGFREERGFIGRFFDSLRPGSPEGRNATARQH
jgi:hypothetical protein